MKIMFTPNAWEQYLYWQAHDQQMVKRIHRLIEESKRNPFDGIGKPEALKHEYSGFWARRITDEHRMVYRVESDALVIVQLRYHY